MKKTILYISISLALFTATVVMPHVMAAQGDTGVGATLTTESGCTWSGSDLTVLDEDLCIITGTVTATSVLIQHDANAAGQAGGKLIVGGTSTNTTFTVSGSFTANGIVEIGAAGNPTHNSTLVTNGTFNISSTGSDGIFTIVSNTNGANSISANNYTMNIGSASTAGVFVNNDDGTSTMTSVSLYGTFNNTAGTITLTGTFIANGSSNAYNGGILNFGSGTSEFKDTSTFNNAGTLTLPAGYNYVYYGSPSGSPTITNSGTFTNGYHNLYGTSSVTNTGTIDITSMAVFSTTGFANNSTGDVNLTSSLVVSTGLFNNKDTATVTVTGTTRIFNTTGTINNYSTFETNTLQFGILATANGGTFNNYGSLTFPTPSDPAINIYRGGNLNNASTGTIVAPNNIFIEGLIGQTATLTNANTTDANAVDVIGNISMNAYSKINNNGNMTVRGLNTITINANDTDIINGANGILNINGDLTLAYDAYLDNDGTVNIAGVSSTASNLILNTSAVFHTKGATAFTGTYQKVQLNNSAQLNVGSAGSLISNPATAANSTLELNNSSSITNAGTTSIKGSVYLNDTSSITNDDSGSPATFTVDDFSTYGNLIQVSGSATFTNEASATVTVDSDTDGIISVLDSGNYTNSGTTNTWRLYVGRHTTAADGGMFTNTGTTGMVYVNSPSTTEADPGIDIYKGQIINSSSYVSASGSFYINGVIYVKGDAGETGVFTNSGVVSHVTRSLYAYDYGKLILTGGRWVGTGTYYINGTTSGSQAEIEITAGAIYSVFNTYYGYHIADTAQIYGKLTNAGEVKIVDVINGNEQSTTMFIYFRNNATFNNNSGGYVRTPGSSSINFSNNSNFSNAGNFNYTASGVNQGYIYIYTPNTITNTGIIYSNMTVLNNTTFTNNNIVNASTLNIGHTSGLVTVFNNTATAVGSSTRVYIGSTLNNTGSMTGSSLHLGLSSSEHGGTVNNDGTTFTYTGTSNIYNNGVFNNYETRTAALSSLYLHTDATVNNNGSITGTNLYVGSVSSSTNVLLSNNTTGTVTNSGTLYVYGNATVILNNNGTVGGSGVLRLGYQLSSTGGIINNYNSFSRGTGLSSIQNGGTFNNKPDATATLGQTTVGFVNGGADSAYNQERGSAGQSGAIKTNFTGGLTIAKNGTLNNYDRITGTSLTTDPDMANNTYGYVGHKGTVEVKSSVSLSGTITINGYITICDATCEKEDSTLTAANAVFLNAAGTLTNNGTFTSTYTANNIAVQGTLRSSPNSEFNLSSAGMGMQSYGITTSTLMEIAGTITNNRPIWTYGGTLCIGSWDGAECTQSRVDLLNYGNITVGHGNNVVNAVGYIANKITVNGTFTVTGRHATYSTTFASTPDSVINVSGNVNILNTLTNATFNGVLTQAGTPGNKGDFNVYDGATATLKLPATSGLYTLGSVWMRGLTGATPAGTTLNFGDASTKTNVQISDYKACEAGGGNCTIELNNSTNSIYTGATTLNNYGNISVTDDASVNPRIQIGNTAPGRSTLNIKADSGQNTLLSTSTGNFAVGTNGQLNVDYINISNYGRMDLAGPAYINGYADDTNGNYGANINGDFECTDLLHVQSGGKMDVGLNGKVKVNGSTTIIDNFTELDGLLDTGSDVGDSLTVTSTGHISSGEGTATNFKILAYDLTVQTGGKISSDGASSLGSASDQPGSYGGDGAGRAGTTYGTAKFIDMNSSTAVPYGEPGRDSGGTVTAKGGGAVRINVTGDILNNGIISANGAEAGALSNGHGGAGGTVLINHDITHLDTSTTFTGTGLIYAYGGAGDGTGRPGGGGRIIINSILFDKPDDGTESEYGLQATIYAFGGSNGANTAAAGTIVFLGDDNNPNGSLYVDQGGAAPTTGSITYIRNTGDFIFDRVEGYDGAQLTYEAAPATLPVSCYETGTVSSSVTIPTYTCTPNPDKPHTMYINNSVTGAQLGTEPAGASPLEVGDLTPVFSVVHMDNQNPLTATGKMQIQVANDPSFGALNLLWDYTTSAAIKDKDGLDVANGVRTRDIEYNEDGTADALSPATTYYVRARFLDATTENPGLWTHRDIGQHYKFVINNYFDIYPKCTNDTFAVSQGVPPEAIRNQPGKRFGAGSCTMGVLSGNTGNWQIKFGMAASEGSNQTIAFNDATSNYITPIDNSATCDMDETGNTPIEQYAFNTYVSPVIDWGTNVDDGGGIENKCNNVSFAADQQYHDVEIFSAMNKIITGTGTTASEKTFPLNIYVNVDETTVPSTTYSLDMAFIMTTDP